MKLRYLFAALLCLCVLITPAAAAGGSGTAASPYIIETAAELQSMQNDLSAYYQLANDIDLSGVTWSPIGSSSAPFMGSLDGNGHTISNLQSSSNGLFTCSGNGCNIYDLTISNFKIITSSTNGIGAIIGSNLLGSNIILNNIVVYDSYLSAPQRVGGIIGYGSGGSGSVTITNCNVINTMCIGSSNRIAGICGGIGGGGQNCEMRDSHVINCIIYNSGDDVVGGLIGDNYGGISVIITDCSVSDSSIYGNSGLVAGIIPRAKVEGSAISMILDKCSVSDCSIYGKGTVSGIISFNELDIVTDCTVSNTNIYGPIIYDIGPAGSYDSTSTATGITNVQNRYLYASSLSADVSGATAAYTLEGRQGSTTVEAETGTAQGMAWNYGDGTTAQTGDTTYTYAEPGKYQTSLKLTNYLDSTGVTVNTGDFNILPIAPVASISANIAQLGDTVSLGAAGILWSGIQWQYTTDGTTWQDISGATTATYDWTPEAGVYTIRAKVTSAASGYTAYSNTVSLTVYAPPTITNPSATPQQGPLSQEVVLSADVSDPNTGTTYQWQEYAAGSWNDISGATAASSTIQVADGAATLHRYRLAATGLGGTAYSGEVTYQSVAPPVFSSFEVSPLSGGIPLTITFSAAASDTSGYRWEYSTDGTIWVQMASGASGSYTFTNEGVYYVRATATGTGGTTISSAATVTASDLLPEFTSVGVSPEYGVAPFTVTLTAAATNGATFVWERMSGSSWVQVGTGSPLSYVVPEGTADGELRFRATAANQYGSVVSSVVSVEVGSAPPAEITAPVGGSVFGSGRSVSFTAADAGSGVTYSWDFGDGLSASGRTVTHSFGSEGDYTITLTTSSRFGSSVDVVQIRIVEATGDIWLAVTDVSSTGADLQATVEVSPVAAGTVVWFEVSSSSGQVVMRSGEITYNGPVTWEASGLPLMSGQTYSVIAYSNNYGFSIPQMFTLVSAVAGEHETLGTEWENGLSKEPFNIGMLVSSGIATYGTVMGGGAVGSAVAFGVIVMFVLVGLWLRQQDVVIPLTLTLVAGWFVIGNLPGDWQPIAYTLMVVCVVAIFFYLFRKRIE